MILQSYEFNYWSVFLFIEQIKRYLIKILITISTQMHVSDKGSKKLTEIKEKMEISRIRVGGFTTMITETDI